MTRVAGCLLILTLLLPATTVAQPAVRDVPAVATPLLERPTAAAGSALRLALEVAVPEGLHLQSNRPRDPSLIPTTLTLDPPDGVTITEVVGGGATRGDAAGSRTRHVVPPWRR